MYKKLMSILLLPALNNLYPFLDYFFEVFIVSFRFAVLENEEMICDFLFVFIRNCEILFVDNLEEDLEYCWDVTRIC